MMGDEGSPDRGSVLWMVSVRCLSVCTVFKKGVVGEEATSSVRRCRRRLAFGSLSSLGLGRGEARACSRRRKSC